MKRLPASQRVKNSRGCTAYPDSFSFRHDTDVTLIRVCSLCRCESDRRYRAQRFQKSKLKSVKDREWLGMCNFSFQTGNRRDICTRSYSTRKRQRSREKQGPTRDSDKALCGVVKRLTTGLTDACRTLEFRPFEGRIKDRMTGKLKIDES